MPNLDSAGFNPTFDPRDHEFVAAEFPNNSRGSGTKVLLRHPVPARAQGAVDCCVATTLVCCMEIIDAQARPFRELSALFLYYAARRYAGRHPNQLVSLTFQQGFSAIQRFGVCERRLHPVRITANLARREPSPAARQNALGHRLRRDPIHHWRYQKLGWNNRAQKMKQVLLNRRPVALAFWITDTYRALEDQIVHPPPRRQGNSAHAVTVIGFDDRIRDTTGQSVGAFLVKDSRGTGFGRDGHWWLPYPMANSGLVYEAWTIAGINYE